MDISELKRISEQKDFRRHPWEVARVRIIKFLLARNKVPFKKILDIGSGDAFVLSQLSTTGIASEYLAVDTAYTPDVVARIQSNEHYHQINFHKDAPENVNADCVLFLDVLEHCNNDSGVLADALRDSLALPGATILVTVPAFQNLFSQHDHLLGHERRYSRKQLRRLMENAGLEVVREGYFFFTLVPVRLLQLLFEKMKIRHAKKSIDGWKGNNTVSRIISTILWADFRVCYFLSRLRIHLPGLSCYCLCKKLPS